MPLSSSILGTELAKMEPVATEAEAITNFTNAWEIYFKDASVLGESTATGTLTTAITAMQGAMTGMSTTGAAAIQTGITQFWTTITPLAPTIWVTVPVVVSIVSPTGLSGIAAALIPVFLANTVGGLSLIDSANAIAAVIHPLQLGGIATITGTPPTTAPIL